VRKNFGYVSSPHDGKRKKKAFGEERDREVLDHKNHSVNQQKREKN